ncbi:MAG: AAA family ATPase, partial [Solirubrobacterales bacterium]
MGFLSRKTKPATPVAVQEPHPIVEELARMEEAVPERPAPAVDATAADAVTGSTAGPVMGQDTSSSQAAGEEPSPTPPADKAPADSPAQAPAAAKTEKDSAPQAAAAAVGSSNGSGTVAVDEPERMKAKDLIAPSRHETAAEEPEAEVATKHAEVIAFANQKGGVAKTTTTLNLAVAFSETGHRVLCIDLDPQGNLTMSQGIDPDKVEKSLYDVLVNDMPISEIIQHREIDIAVSSIDLAGAEIAMSTKIGRERSLEKALKEVSGDYDFICIDTPPSLGLLTINALTAASKVIVPVQCEYLSMRGLVQLQNTLKMIQENLNPDVKIEGILP